MIGEKFNMEDVFFRDLTVCVLDTLEGQIRWLNKFTSGDYPVEVPIYYSLTGDERFLLDSFADDIVSENRFVELNTDVMPRGHLTFKSFNISSDEFANPNVWLRMVVENEFEIRKILAKVRAVPIVVDYDLTILLSNEIDTFKCSQAILDTLWIYKFMYFEHNFMNIDAVMLVPDTNAIEITREKTMTSDNTIKLTVSFQVQTYYPAFRKDRVNPEGYPRYYGDGMQDLNGYSLSGGFSDFFGTQNAGSSPNVSTPAGSSNGFSTRPPITPNGFTVRQPSTLAGFPAGYPLPPPFTSPFLPSSINGQPVWQNTGIGGNQQNNPAGTPGGPTTSGTQSNPGSTFSLTSGSNTINPNPSVSAFGGTSPVGAAPTDNPNYFMYSPKKARWFSNILRARQRAATPILNPNGRNPNPQNGTS